MTRGRRLVAVVASLLLPIGVARAAFELGDASPGSLGAAAPEGPRAWMVAGKSAGDPPPGLSLALHHASLFDAPGLFADGATISLSGARVAGELELGQVSAGVARERTLRIRLRDAARRPVGLLCTAERLDLVVPGAPTVGGWAAGFGAFGRARLRGAEVGVIASAEWAARSGGLAGLGVGADVRVEAACTASGATLTVADRWGADGGHRPRLSLDVSLGGNARLRIGRSAMPAAAGLALAVRAGPWQIGVGRLEDPDGSSITSAEITIHRGGPAPGAPLVSLSGSGASATMLPGTQIRGIVGATSAERAPASAESAPTGDAVSPGEGSGSGRFIPDAAVDLEEPESLDEPARMAGAGATLSVTAKGDPSTRTWWRSREVSTVVAVRESETRGGLVLSRGEVSLGAGTMALPGMGIVGERARLTRAERGASLSQSPREALRPTSGSGVDVAGVAVAWRPAARYGSGISARVAVGTRSRAGGSIVASEFRAPLDAASAATFRAAAWREEPGAAWQRVIGVRWDRTGEPGRFGAEVAHDGEGLHADVGASVRRRGLAASARWRHRAGAARASGADIEAGWHAARGGARLRWRAWSVRGTGDTGRAELDLRAGRGGPGSWRLRLGGTPERARGVEGERLAIGEIVAAREPGRTLRILGSVRAAPSGNGWRYGRALGASLALRRGRRAAIDLRAEAVRVERDAAATVGSFEVASGGSLRTRARGGVRLAARGWLALGAWRLGAAVDDEDSTESTTARATRARLWFTWNAATRTL